MPNRSSIFERSMLDKRHFEQYNAYINLGKANDVGADIFSRGLCLPSDNKMTPEQQDIIIEIIKSCFE